MEMWIFGPPMMAASKSQITYLIRLSAILSLIFFACLITGCGYAGEQEVRLVWKEDKATSVLIPEHLLVPASADSIHQLLELRLSGPGKPAIIGTMEKKNDLVEFVPLVPFSRGLSYSVYFRGRQVGSVRVPLADSAARPAVLAIYPSNDTLPENLLKFYLQFSRPMRTGESLKRIFLVDENNDTLRDVFLELQPELWNPENTVLTIWLDPGRIKRDLIPNQKFGNPLTAGKRYKLVVSESWKDQQELNLQDDFTKEFLVTARDERSPLLSRWHFDLPVAGSQSPLKISFQESLDYFLLPETIALTDQNGNSIPGNIKILPKEKGIEFIPKTSWQPGKYSIAVAPHLEDLAGNNLEKLFDRDLTQQTASAPLTRDFVLPAKRRQP